MVKFSVEVQQRASEKRINKKMLKNRIQQAFSTLTVKFLLANIFKTLSKPRALTERNDVCFP